MLLLLVLLAANGFISTAATDEIEAIEYGSKVVAVEDVSPSCNSPIEPNTDVVPPNYSRCYSNGTIKCRDDEILDTCPSYCPSDFCPTGDGQNQKCPQPSPCPPPDCKCRFNSRRAQNGTCISTRDCPAFECKKPNEEYNPCPPYCPSDSCSQATPTGKCPLPGRILIILECRPTCRCKKGFWRLDNGTCVPYDQCPGKQLTCGPNEVVDNCPVDCKSDYCPTSDEPVPACPKPSICPAPACKCAFNYRRSANGTCIPTTECPPYQCKDRNEEFNPCPPICPSDDCSQATPDGRCPRPGNIGIVLPCQPKCRCKKNYWRKDGKCVPYLACPGKLKCPPGDVVDECPLICNTDYCPKDENDVRYCSIPLICPEPACRCPFNYLRAANGTCIPASSCPPIKCCKPHEVFNSCPPLCPTDDCRDATPSGKCPRPGNIDVVVECRPGCRCEKNYWRKNGTCVPFAQCGLDCSGGNEYYACGGACDNVCKDLHIQNQDNCPIRNIRCNDMCYCQKGFARDDKGICIPLSQCPKKKNALNCTGPNEYADCSVECDNVCKDLHLQSKENCPIKNKKCVNKCYCKDGFARDDKGICIPINECPKNKDKRCPFPNEEYTECKKTCPSDRCSSVLEFCIPKDTCSPGCVCLPGYLREIDGSPCVPTCKCPQLANSPECQAQNSGDKRCPFPNEEYTDCKKTCPSDKCSSVLEKCIPSKTCSPGCVCSSGYLRERDGSPCIPEWRCPQLANSTDCSTQS